MTPGPPSSSDGQQLPPRHRPTLGDLAKDTTESDLWDFDDDLVIPDDPAPLRPDVVRGSKGIPSPREGRKTESESASADGGRQKSGGEKIRLNVGKIQQIERGQGPGSSPGSSKGDFDELDHWEDVPQVSEIGSLPEIPEVYESQAPADKLSPMPVPAETSERLSAPKKDIPPIDAPRNDFEAASEDDEFSPVVQPGATPISLRPHLGLSKVERWGLIVLAVILLVAAGVAYRFSINRIPSESALAKETKFPIKGSLLTVKSAETYWRAPITDGASPDTFRRGTALLPVIDLKIEEANAAIRVLFRNDEKSVVGDAVTRTIHAGAPLSIAATAGFDEPGMHAAYRTGEGKPWTVEVYEAPSEAAAGRDFKLVFEMKMSTDLR